MHPDLYLVVYRQQERELEHRLEQRRSIQARTDAGPGRRARRTLVHLPHRRAAAPR